MHEELRETVKYGNADGTVNGENRVSCPLWGGARSDRTQPAFLEPKVVEGKKHAVRKLQARSTGPRGLAAPPRRNHEEWGRIKYKVARPFLVGVFLYYMGGKFLDVAGEGHKTGDRDNRKRC